MKQNILFFTILSLLLINCSSDRDKIIKQIEEWQGKAIKFPENMLYAKDVKDTLDYKIPDANYKILLYVDSTGCTTCKLKFNKWKQVIKEIDSLTNKNVAFLFFFQTTNTVELRYLLRRESIHFPVYIDTENKLDKLNNFSKIPMFQCFLLDRQNKVIGIGNPVYNSKVKEFYISKITGKKYKKQFVATTSAKLISPQTIDLGDFKKADEQYYEILVKNTGKNALIIKAVDASCGCLKIDYSHKPVKPNENAIIKIKYIADNTGFFSKNLKISCNANNSPFSVLIKGVAK